MVKNTKGGKGAKSMARKSVSSADSSFPIPTSNMEHIALVTKMFGPACEVILSDGTILFCHIRNKFKGRRKSSNFISIGSFILVGLREWETLNPPKNCDLLFVYDSLQTNSLLERFSLPSLSHSSPHDSSPHDSLFLNHDDSFQTDHFNNLSHSSDFNYLSHSSLSIDDL